MEDLNTPAQKHTISIPPLQHGRSAARLPNPFCNHKQMTNPTERHNDQYCLWTMIAQANTAIKEDMKLKEDGSNFVTWEDNMAMLLDDFIDDADYLSTTDGTNIFDEKICRSLLIHLVSNTICEKIIKLRPCSTIYSYLKNHYHILTQASQVLTWQELLSTQMKDGESTMALVDRILTRVRGYKNTNGKLNEDHILGLLLQQATTSQPAINTLLKNKLEPIVTTYGQTPNFGQIVSALEACTRQVTAQQAVEATKTNTINLQQLTMDDTTSLADIGQEKDFTPDDLDPEILRTVVRGTCHLCKQPGHFVRNCPHGKRWLTNSDSSQQFQAYYPILAPTVLDTLPNKAPPDLYRPRYKPPPVKARFFEMGTEEPDIVILKVDLGKANGFEGCSAGALLSSKSNDILICNTSHIPILRARLCKNKMKWEMPPFLTDHLNILRANDRNESGELHRTRGYPITILRGKIAETQGNVQELSRDILYSLHSLFGHIGMKRLKQIVQQRFGNTAATNLPRKMANCAHCLVMKSLHHNPLASRGYTILPMDVVAADLMGPFDGALPSSRKYALTIRDISSTYSECHVLLRKADATTVLLQVLAKCETKTNKKIKILRSNNGGEFCNAFVSSWCTNRGTTHEKSLPYNHKQNGTIEKYNQSIADMGRTLLKSSGLPTAFWGSTRTKQHTQQQNRRQNP
ncbi:hypothetical protein O181_043214 [Austropuccinia psidii MF-1]|uniref:Integrase catalytic domain-containing protein n=1 Tax=Austropuccinia psidii MF-1 TaxID=1389203 RepID=A0A9Q3HI76_9BASI|nr:hypothetical protein [Austropuccinia psidii MF-1]